MLVDNAEAPSMTAAATQAEHRATFFRQSGWLMIANIGGGVLMWAVHLLNRFLPGGEYGSFGTFLAVVMVLPTMPLQMIMTQQTAKALATGREHELSGVIRAVWLWTSLLWLVAAVVVAILHNQILEAWHMTDPVGLWVTLPVVLLSLWLPMFWGLMQGQQNFLWLGWSMLSNGIGRIAVAAVAVVVLHAYAGGMMTGVLLGIMIAIGIAAWQTRRLWLAKAAPIDGLNLLHQILPLVLGFLGFQILLTADTIFVKAYFPKATVDFYFSAGTMSRALMWLVLPLASVMFPRLVHSAARGEKTNLLGMVLLGTAGLGVVGALGLSLVGPFVVPIIYPGEGYAKVASALLPWYVGAMVPLAVANVLLNHLLARPSSKFVPALGVFLLALGYLVAVTRFHQTPVMVLKTLAVFGLLLLALCAWFTWVKKGPTEAGKRT
jgi:O-antigen/teichoic acid export membrane protein